MRFTEKTLLALKPKAAAYTVTETGVSSDMRGLQIRVEPTGTKTFRFRHKIDGRERPIRLGGYPTMTIAEAHRQVQAYREQIGKGIDPVAEREATKQANRSAPTVQHLFEDFRDYYLRRKRKRPAEAEAILENHVLPDWMHRKAKSITRREIIEHVRDLAEKNGPRIAEVTKGLIGQMFGYAVDTGLLDASPASRIPVIGSRGAKRERILTDDQIKAFWNAPINAMPQIRAALRLLLATGQRRQEVALARWEHIDRKTKTWLIPAENSKNGRAHSVPLSRLALDLLDELAAAGRRKHKGGTESVSTYVVPSRLLDDQPIEPLALTRAVRNNRDVYGFDFTPHDLRRTCASGMAALGTSRLVVGKVLNHTDDSVTAIYDRHDYADEKRQALDTWAAHLQAVIAGEKSKVVPMKNRSRRAAR
ncbi:MAG: tyrosine-type recombinase/integrase [Gammaproteobacteria bacterium]|nr:tyrosine-type recombinase/integrase [Gammaproteobacteria bacterium]